MKLISAAEFAGVADYKSIVEALREGFRTDIESPVRHFHDTSSVAKLMLMPAWSKAWTGLKTVVVKSDNAAQGLPTVQASYLLIDNETGAPVAVMDGTELTRRRTAAASALAADYLARPDASHLALWAPAHWARILPGPMPPCAPSKKSRFITAPATRPKNLRSNCGAKGLMPWLRPIWKQPSDRPIS